MTATTTKHNTRKHNRTQQIKSKALLKGVTKEEERSKDKRLFSSLCYLSGWGEFAWTKQRCYLNCLINHKTPQTDLQTTQIGAHFPSRMLSGAKNRRRRCALSALEREREVQSTLPTSSLNLWSHELKNKQDNQNVCNHDFGTRLFHLIRKEILYPSKAP